MRKLRSSKGPYYEKKQKDGEAQKTNPVDIEMLQSSVGD